MIRANCKTVRVGDGYTALHCIAQKGGTDIVEALIKGHALVNAKNKQGETALHLAAAHCNADLVTSLIEKGAHVSARDCMLRKPLHCATATDDNIEVVRVLLCKLEEIEARDSEGRLPGTKEKDRLGNSALHYSAAAGGGATVAELLMDYGAVLESKNNVGERPLHIAASNGNTDTARLLIEKYHAEIDARAGDQSTPLHLCAARGHTGTVTMLLEQGADFTLVNREGKTALHLAAELGRKETVTMLIAIGSDLTQTDDSGKTPLALALLNVAKLDAAELKKLVRMLESAWRSQSFCKEYCEFSGTVHASVVLERLVSLISRRRELQLFYTAVTAIYKQERLFDAERNELIRKGLDVAVRTAIDVTSFAVFKRTAKRAFNDKCITDSEMMVLIHKASLHTVSESEFIEEMRECISANSRAIARINDRLDTHEKAILANSNTINMTAKSLRDFLHLYRERRNTETAAAFLRFTLNACSFGIGGEARGYMHKHRSAFGRCI